MNVQELNIVELENRFEMSATAEAQCIDPETYIINSAGY
jgi:hypothetical protein